MADPTRAKNFWPGPIPNPDQKGFKFCLFWSEKCQLKPVFWYLLVLYRWKRTKFDFSGQISTLEIKSKPGDCLNLGSILPFKLKCKHFKSVKSNLYCQNIHYRAFSTPLLVNGISASHISYPMFAKTILLEYYELCPIPD